MVGQATSNSADESAANDSALVDGSRIFSVYRDVF
jgi:hypothetical protein